MQIDKNKHNRTIGEFGERITALQTHFNTIVRLRVTLDSTLHPE